MSEHRTHLVTLLQMIWRFLFLLIFPAARGFLTALSGGNVAEWLDGAWKDILIITAILLLAFLQWWCLRYRWESVGLSIRRGVLFRQRMFIPAAKIITMSLTRPFYLKPVGGVRLRVDTWAGAGNSTDISLILPKKAAESIFSKRENALSDLDFAPREYHPKGLYVTCLAAILSSSFAGVLFFATFISQTGSLLGQEFADRITGTFERLTRAIAWGIPPATVAVAYLIIFGWLYSFIRNLIRHKNFVVRRRKNELYIDSGIITNRSYSIRLDEINYIDIRQSLVTKLLGLYSVFVNAVGYGKEKDDISAMIPANPWERLASAFAAAGICRIPPASETQRRRHLSLHSGPASSHPVHSGGRFGAGNAVSQLGGFHLFYCLDGDAPLPVVFGRAASGLFLLRHRPSGRYVHAALFQPRSAAYCCSAPGANLPNRSAPKPNPSL